MQLEIGGHTNTVRSIAFSQAGVDFLCLTGGSDGRLKLWDLRQRRCISDYGGAEDDDEFGATTKPSFHTDSIWNIEPSSTFDTCFTGGRDGSIYHTDLAGDDQYTLLYKGGKRSPINCLSYDAVNQKLWFATTNDSSLKHLDMKKRSLAKAWHEEPEEKGAAEQAAQIIGASPQPVGVQRVSEPTKVNLKTPDYELEGLPWITEYHMLKNKRYIITNNSRGVAQVWNIDGCKFVKTYHSKDFAGVKDMMNDKYDL